MNYLSHTSKPLNPAAMSIAQGAIAYAKGKIARFQKPLGFGKICCLVFFLCSLFGKSFAEDFFLTKLGSDVTIVMDDGILRATANDADETVEAILVYLNGSLEHSQFNCGENSCATGVQHLEPNIYLVKVYTLGSGVYEEFVYID